MCKSYFFCELKASGGSSTQQTLDRYGKVNPTSLFGYDVQRRKKKIRIFFTVGLAYKIFFSSYCVIVDRPGEGNSEKNCCW